MRSRVTARTDPLLHSRAMLSATTSTQQYISGAQRLIWVVVCHKNTMRKVAQHIDWIGNYKIETKQPKIATIRRHAENVVRILPAGDRARDIVTGARAM